jgi:phosphatidylglycerol lysyltransferase
MTWKEGISVNIEETGLNKMRAYSILKECSSDSQHYLSFTEENSFFFGDKVYGLISYILVGKNAMSIGDPVCKIEDLEALTNEYIDFCKRLRYKPIFNSVSSQMAEILRKQKFSVLKYGEEAVLELSKYTLSGTSRSALRRNVSNVGKSGVTMQEYQPKTDRDYALEKEIADLSAKWLADKKFRMNYSIGTLDFENPYDRRFFYSKDKDGNLLTFLSFMPYENNKSFCIDIMIRRMDAITGVMEHAIISAVMILKEDGVSKVSLGIAPLAGIDITKPGVNKIEKVMNAIFHNGNFGYNFKNLYRFKRKFDPTTWEPRYLVYHRGIPLISLAASIVNTKRGSTDLVLYAKCKLFLIAVGLGLYKTEQKVDKGGSRNGQRH